MTLAAAASALALSLSSVSHADEKIVLRFHHFLPANAPIHKYFTDWARRVEQQSNGRIDVKVFPALQLGGKPTSMYDQAKSGQVDIAWAVPGHTINRFPKAEVFDIPLMARSAETTSQAAYSFYEKHLRDEFADVHLLNYFTNPPCVLLSTKRVTEVSDMRGVRLRSTNRTISRYMTLLGAEPIQMPVPDVPQALSSGVLDGITFPFESAVPLRIPELTKFTITFGKGDDKALCTTSHVIVMNKDRYQSLPADLKKVIDDNSGLKEAARIGRHLDDAERSSMANYKGPNQMIVIPKDKLGPWLELADKVAKEWIADMTKRGYDAQKLYDDAVTLIEKFAAARGS